MTSWLFEHSGTVVFVGAIIVAVGGWFMFQARLQSERELRAKSDEIAKLNRTITDWVTGGDSFCHISVGVGDGKSDTVELRLLNGGEYPLYEVSMIIFDWDRKTQITTPIAIPNPLPLRSNLLVGMLELPAESDQKAYTIIIQARNGTVEQRIGLARINGAWRFATRVYKGFQRPEAEILYENVPPEFPDPPRGFILGGSPG